MAITVNIYCSGVDGNAKKFAEEMVSSGVVGDIRAEDGNHVSDEAGVSETDMTFIRE